MLQEPLAGCFCRIGIDENLILILLILPVDTV